MNQHPSIQFPAAAATAAIELSLFTAHKKQVAYQENYTAIETLFVASVGPAWCLERGDNIMNHKVGVITYSRKKWHKTSR